MLRIIEDLPQDVLGIEAIGRVTHDDYKNLLIPEAEARIALGPIRMLYVIGNEAEGFELEALWDDSRFGLKHWRDFSRIGVVTDQRWLRAAVSLFAPLMPAQVRLFAVAEIAAAKDWITAEAGAN